MRTFLPRLVGVLLVIASILGLIGGISGLIFTWYTVPGAIQGVTSSIDLFSRTLNSTSQMLLVANDSLKQVDQNVALISSSMKDVASSLQATSKMSDSMATLIGVDLTKSLLKTEDSLVSVRNSAHLIDQILRVASFLPGTSYNRNMTLEDSIAQVQDSLIPLPASMADVQSNLKQTAQNFNALNQDVSQLSVTIGNIQTSLNQAEIVVSNYQSIISDTQSALERARDRIPLYMKITAGALTFFLVWFVIVQIPLFMRGWGMMVEK